MPFQIIRANITTVEADAIVNTANPLPRVGAGTDYAVYTAAGMEDMLAERRKIGQIHPGEAAVTPAFALPARYVIHTVGPSWEGGGAGEFEALASCYRKSLLLARQLGCESIVFPLISTGTYGFPKDKALQIAMDTIGTFLEDEDMDVTLAVLNREAYELSAELAADVRAYIDDHSAAALHAMEYSYQGMPRPVPPAPKQKRRLFSDLLGKKARVDHEPFEDAEATAAKMTAGSVQGLPDRLAAKSDTFQEKLFSLIDEREMADTEVYKKANLDRKLFSKIRSNADYAPKKTTVLALAVALRLDLAQTKDLLARAGYAFSPSSTFDLIVQYCFEKEIYDIFRVNALLFEYDQPLLGSK